MAEGAWIDALRRDARVRTLCEAVTLAEGFSLHVVECGIPRTVAALRALVTDALVSRGLGALDVVDPYAALARWDDVLDPERLTRDVLGALLESRVRERIGALVVDGSAARRSDADAWSLVFARMNERRASVLRACETPVLLVVGPTLARRFVDDAPDVWSLRSYGMVLGDAPPPRVHQDDRIPALPPLAVWENEWARHPLPQGWIPRLDELRGRAGAAEMIWAVMIHARDATQKATDGYTGRAAEHLESLVRLALPPAVRAELLVRLGEVRRARGELREAATCFREALAAGPSSLDGVSGVIARAGLSLSLVADGHLAEAQAECDALREALLTGPLRMVRDRVTPLALASVIAWHRGELDRSDALAADAMVHLNVKDHLPFGPFLIHWAAELCVERGLPQRALEFVDAFWPGGGWEATASDLVRVRATRELGRRYPGELARASMMAETAATMSPPHTLVGAASWFLAERAEIAELSGDGTADHFWARALAAVDEVLAADPGQPRWARIRERYVARARAAPSEVASSVVRA